MDPLDALTRRVDVRLLPILTCLYFFSYLDRINIGNAQLFNITQDTNTTPDEFNWAVSIFYISYVTFEVPSNLFMRRFGPSRWIGSLMVAWGVIMILMIRVRDAKGLMISRFFLGVAEAGFFPGVIYYLTLWYRRKDQGLRMAIFFSGASLAGAFGGLLAYGIGQLSETKGLSGWQWIFLFEGIPTVCLGIWTYLFLVDYPHDVMWLNQCHKDILLNGLRVEECQPDHTEEKFSWRRVGTLLKDWKIPLFMGINFGALTPVFALSTFLPSIIADLDYHNVNAQLLTVPPYLSACVISILITWSSTRSGERGFHILFCLGIGIAGFFYLIFNIKHQYIGTFLAAIGVFSAYALIPSWLTCNMRGKLKRAIAVGLVAASGSVGGILSGQIYRKNDQEDFSRGHRIMIIIQAVTVLLVIVLKGLLANENRKNSRTKETTALLTKTEKDSWLT